MDTIFEIPLNKSIIINFGSNYKNEGGFYYNGYQELFSELKPKETLLEVYNELRKIENGYEYLVDFRTFIENKASESIIGDASFKFNQDEKRHDVKIYHSRYVLFIELLLKFSNQYFKGKDDRFKDFLAIINNESAKFVLNPYCHILLKTIKIVFGEFVSYADIRDYVDKSMGLIDEEPTIANSEREMGEIKDHVFKKPTYNDFFYYLVNKSLERKNGAFFSYIYKYFQSNNFLTYNKPRYYLKFINEKYKLELTKIYDGSCAKNKDLFVEFDGFFKKFNLKKTSSKIKINK